MELNRKEVLHMKDIHKSFPGVKALDNVSIRLNEGEVLALLGENGAGKSTLLKILSGVYRANEGQILMEGVEKNFQKPRDSSDAGISIIYQELSYLNDLTVAENIFLGRQPRKEHIGIIDWKEMNRLAAEALKNIGVDINPREHMRNLSVAQKQLVEIAKTLSQNMKILVMDEPTAALSDKEVERLLQLVKEITAGGVSVIYISHRLEELFMVADRVSVLRDGKSVGEILIQDATKDKLVSMMVGRDIKDMYPKEQIDIKETVFEVKNLRTGYLKDISFNARKGEVVGLFGLMGSGRTEIVETIFGLRKKTFGNITVNGRSIEIKSPRKAISVGLAYVPSERKLNGLILCQKVKENITTATIKKICKFGVMSLKKEKEIASMWIKSLGIRTPSSETVVESLSGGNQQKVVLSKWLESCPKILIMNEPTRGIDVGAKVEIYKIMEELCKQGMSIIMISSELPEIIALSDRIFTFCNGRVTGEYDRHEVDQEILMHSAIGGI